MAGMDRNQGEASTHGPSWSQAGCSDDWVESLSHSCCGGVRPLGGTVSAASFADSIGEAPMASPSVWAPAGQAQRITVSARSFPAALSPSGCRSAGCCPANCRLAVSWRLLRGCRASAGQDEQISGLLPGQKRPRPVGTSAGHALRSRTLAITETHWHYKDCVRQKTMLHRNGLLPYTQVDPAGRLTSRSGVSP